MIYNHKKIACIYGRQTPGAQLISIKYEDGSQLKIMGHPWAWNKVHIYFDCDGNNYVEVQNIAENDSC